MDDDHLDDPNDGFDFRSSRPRPVPEDDDFDLDVDLDDDGWSGVGARRGPRNPAEGVRIIGADEAAAAIESGQVAPKKPEDELRFGDVPPQPAGPRPSLRFPGADPRKVDKPAVAGEPLPPQERDPAAEAARRWDEALARSSESRSRVRSSSALFGDDDPDDLFGYARSTSGAARTADTPPPGPPMASASGGPPPPPTGPPGPPSSGPPPGGGGYRSNWLDEDDDDLTAPPVSPPSPRYEPTSLQHWTEPPSGEVPRILVDDEDEQPADDDLSAWGSLGARPRWRDQPNDWEDADFNESILADEGHRMGALRAKPDDSGPFSFDDLEPEPPPPPMPQDPSPSPRPGPPGRTRISTLPTSGPPPMPPGGGRAIGGDSRDVSTRVVTGAVAGGVVLVAAAIGPAALVFLVAVVLTMAVAELYQGLRLRGYHPATLLGLVGTASLVGAVYWKGLDAYPLVIALFVVFTLLWYLTGVVRARPTMNVAVTVLAFLYVSFLGSFAALMLKAGSAGIRILIGAILATVAYDIGAFFTGRSMGRTPLAPAISPNKTVEGLVGASLATLLACLVIVRAIDPWDGGKAFWLAVVVSLAAPLGDLCESMIKRDLDVKDMGNVLPGHGGVLDRIDALLFVIPATYYLVRLVF